MSSSASSSAAAASPATASPKLSTPEFADEQNPRVSGHPNGSTSEVFGEDREGEGEGEGEGEEEDEEEGECGFCLFMKGGGCRDEFIAWENCIEEAEKNKEDIVEKCFEVTGLLKKCMEAHSDYYEPVLKAEKAAAEEASKELEQETSPKQ